MSLLSYLPPKRILITSRIGFEFYRTFEINELISMITIGAMGFPYVNNGMGNMGMLVIPVGRAEEPMSPMMIVPVMLGNQGSMMAKTMMNMMPKPMMPMMPNYPMPQRMMMPSAAPAMISNRHQFNCSHRKISLFKVSLLPRRYCSVLFHQCQQQFM